MYGGTKSKPVPKKRSATPTYTERRGNFFWGPAYWKTIHSACATFDPANRESFLLWIYSFPDQLPCSICASHMIKNLKIFPPEEWVGSRDNLFVWSYRFHDMVNRSKDPPTVSPPFEQVKKFYYGSIFNCAKCAATGE
jgi:Erv1 / Alr family